MLPWKKQERGVKDSVSDESHLPQPRVIHPGNHDLPRCEFKQFAPGTLAVCGNEAFRYENDPCPCAVRGVRDGIVVADRTLPRIEDVQTFEGGSIYRGRAAPGEITIVIAENTDGGSIPA